VQLVIVPLKTYYLGPACLDVNQAIPSRVCWKKKHIMCWVTMHQSTQTTATHSVLNENTCSSIASNTTQESQWCATLALQTERHHKFTTVLVKAIDLLIPQFNKEATIPSVPL
jgi:hypothetical protein